MRATEGVDLWYSIARGDAPAEDGRRTASADLAAALNFVRAVDFGVLSLVQAKLEDKGGCVTAAVVEKTREDIKQFSGKGFWD